MLELGEGAADDEVPAEQLPTSPPPLPFVCPLCKTELHGPRKSAGRMTIVVPSAEEVKEANERRRRLFAVNMRSLLYA